MRRVTKAILTASLGISIAAAPAWAGSFTSLYSFSGGVDGKEPLGKLVQDAGGVLYGVTVSGGSAQRGNIYSFDPATGTLTTLYSFSGGADGGNPQAGLELDSKGNLYGVTPRGGSTNCNLGCGTIFRYSIAKAKLTTLYSFMGLADGALPLAPLTLSKNVLYGATTEAGTGSNCGVSGCGTIFSLVPGTGAFTVLRELTTPDGVLGEGRMSPGPAGQLYGTAAEGGPHGSGVVFSIDPATGAYAVLHGFDYHVDGSRSDADVLVQGTTIYGTTPVGGPTGADDGTVFSLDTKTGVLAILYSFQGGSDGEFPSFGVTLGKGGQLLGQALQGAESDEGAVFALKPKTLAFKVVHDFASGAGMSPSGRLLSDGTGGYVGVTSAGGGGSGTIFRLVP